METNKGQKITIQADIMAPVEKVWELYTKPEHVVNWNAASDDWHSPSAENDLMPGGSFNYRMEAKDGSAGFDFYGTYDRVEPHEIIAYTMGDGRKVEVVFTEVEGGTNVTVTFEAESTNSIDMQREGWQAILDRFKVYTELK